MAMFKNIIYLRLQLQPTVYQNAKYIQFSNQKRDTVQIAVTSSSYFDSSPERLKSTILFEKWNICNITPLSIKKTICNFHLFHVRNFSMQTDKESQADINKISISDGNKNKQDEDEEPIVAMYDERGNKLSNWTRMKMMAKAYGYVIIPVHWIIAPVWFGSFYLAVTHGIDILPLLKNLGVSEVYLSKMETSGASDILQAYAMYKVATPARYTLTLGATEMTIRALRKWQLIKPLPPKEKTYRESMQETYAGMKEKMEDVKEKMDDVKDRMTEVRDKLKDSEKDKQN